MNIQPQTKLPVPLETNRTNPWVHQTETKFSNQFDAPLNPVQIKNHESILNIINQVIPDVCLRNTRDDYYGSSIFKIPYYVDNAELGTLFTITIKVPTRLSNFEKRYEIKIEIPLENPKNSSITFYPYIYYGYIFRRFVSSSNSNTFKTIKFNALKKEAWIKFICMIRPLINYNPPHKISTYQNYIYDELPT